jgi:hypothetical protein
LKITDIPWRAEVRAVEGVRLVEGRNQRSWNIEDEAILKKFSGLKIPKAYHHTKKVFSNNISFITSLLVV